MSESTATARRTGGRYWQIQCDQVPAAFSQVTQLAEAADVHREAIVWVTHEQPGEVKVTVTPELPEDATELITSGQALREHADQESATATQMIRDGAGRLVRDACRSR